MITDEEMLADAQVATNDNVTKSLSVAIGDWAKLDEEKTTLEARLKTITDEMSAMKLKSLPDLLAAFGSLSFTDEVTGLVVALETLVTGSLVKKDLEKRASQLKYIADNGGSSLIKTTIEIVFDKGDNEKAKNLVTALKENGIEPDVTESVHAASLCAWGRDKLEAGAEIDFEKAGLFVVKLAEPKTPIKKTTKVRTKK